MTATPEQAEIWATMPADARRRVEALLREHRGQAVLLWKASQRGANAPETANGWQCPNDTPPAVPERATGQRGDSWAERADLK
jgi:hypothetical protein